MKRWLKWPIRLILFFFISTILTVVVLKWVPVYFTPLMFIRCAEQKIAGKPFSLHQTWLSENELPASVKLAVVCSEDQLFFNHHGFDLEAIDKAIDFNKQHKRKRGASTISQQTAKNVFLWPGRSFIRKGFEVYFTLLIEWIWGKDRILTVYLNVIEVGDGHYGVASAAKDYFHVTPSRVSNAQAALLAAVLPNPRKFSIVSPSAYIVTRRNWILEQMNNNASLYNSKLKPTL